VACLMPCPAPLVRSARSFFHKAKGRDGEKGRKGERKE